MGTSSGQGVSTAPSNMRAFAFVLLAAAAVNAEADAKPYTIGQVNHGLTAGGVITGVDYGNGVVSGLGAIGNRPANVVPAVSGYSHNVAVPAVSAVHSVGVPAVRTVATPSVYNTIATPSVYNTVANPSVYNTIATPSLYNNLYSRHHYGKREAEAEPEADAQFITGVHNNVVPAVSSYTHNVAVPAVSALHSVGVPAVHTTVGAYNTVATASVYKTVATPSVYKTVATPSVYNTVATPSVYNNLYSRHYYAKREADAEAYTIGQVHHGLPVHNAYAAGHPHNFGYTRYVSSPSVYSGVSHHGYTGHSVYPRVGHIGSYYV